MKYKKNNMFQKTIDGLSREEAAYFWSYINDLKSDAGRVRNMKKNEKRLHNKINDLQTRIDKAIDYINDIYEPDLRIIEEILKGEEK